MTSELHNEELIPFFDEDDQPVPYDKFIGREKLRQEFLQLTWDFKRRKNRQDSIWVIKGRSAYGKTSFAQWCMNEAIERASDKSVVLSDFDLLVFGKDAVVSTEEFYTKLSERVVNDFKNHITKKRPRWYIKETGRIVNNIWEFLSTAEIFIKLPNPPKSWRVPLSSKAHNPEEFFRIVEKLYKYSSLKMGAFVILIDNVSYPTNGSVLCSDLIFQMKNILSKWPVDHPNILFVFLPFPWWDDSLGAEGLQKRIKKDEILKPFELPEIIGFISSKCILPLWDVDNTFAPALHAMSGGIPYLFHKIGAGACRISMALDQHAPYKLTGDTVVQAVGEDERVNSVIGKVLEGSFGLKLSSFDKNLLTGLYNVTPTNNIDWKKAYPPVIEGLTFEDWQTKTIAAANLGKGKVHRDEFDKIWRALSDKGVLEIRDRAKPGHERFAFVADAFRRYFFNYSHGSS